MLKQDLAAPGGNPGTEAGRDLVAFERHQVLTCERIEWEKESENHEEGKLLHGSSFQKDGIEFPFPTDSIPSH